MPKQLVYRGPAATFDTGGLFPGKTYSFEREDRPGTTKAQAVNNEHAEELLTYPHHFFEDVGEAPQATHIPVGTSIGGQPPQET